MGPAARRQLLGEVRNPTDRIWGSRTVDAVKLELSERTSRTVTRTRTHTRSAGPNEQRPQASRSTATSRPGDLRGRVTRKLDSPGTRTRDRGSAGVPCERVGPWTAHRSGSRNAHVFCPNSNSLTRHTVGLRIYSDRHTHPGLWDGLRSAHSRTIAHDTSTLCA